MTGSVVPALASIAVAISPITAVAVSVFPISVAKPGDGACCCVVEHTAGQLQTGIIQKIQAFLYLAKRCIILSNDEDTLMGGVSTIT